jgi:NIPSNAP
VTDVKQRRLINASSQMLLAMLAVIPSLALAQLSEARHESMSSTLSPSDVGGADLLSPIVELRQYTLHPGQRDVLIELFEREFIESQEALGARVIGEFRDLDNPDLFFWLRGFADMPARAAALTSFYGGPTWKAHRDAANATMMDSDNVLLLRPARSTSAFRLSASARPRAGMAVPAALIVATIYYLRAPPADGFIDWFEQVLQPQVQDAGATALASFFTEPSPNNFPPLPVREGENAFVWFACFADLDAYQRHLATLAQSAKWRELSAQLAVRLKYLPEVHRLAPAPRSLLRSCPTL